MVWVGEGEKVNNGNNFSILHLTPVGASACNSGTVGQAKLFLDLFLQMKHSWQAYIYIKELYRYNSVFNLQNRARKYFCINYQAGFKDIKYDIIMSQIELEHTQIQNTTCLG